MIVRDREPKHPIAVWLPAIATSAYAFVFFGNETGDSAHNWRLGLGAALAVLAFYYWWIIRPFLRRSPDSWLALNGTTLSRYEHGALVWARPMAQVELVQRRPRLEGTERWYFEVLREDGGHLAFLTVGVKHISLPLIQAVENAKALRCRKPATRAQLVRSGLLCAGSGVLLSAVGPWTAYRFVITPGSVPSWALLALGAGFFVGPVLALLGLLDLVRGLTNRTLPGQTCEKLLADWRRFVATELEPGVWYRYRDDADKMRADWIVCHIMAGFSVAATILAAITCRPEEWGVVASVIVTLGGISILCYYGTRFHRERAGHRFLWDGSDLHVWTPKGVQTFRGRERRPIRGERTSPWMSVYDTYGRGLRRYPLDPRWLERADEAPPKTE